MNDVTGAGRTVMKKYLRWRFNYILLSVLVPLFDVV